MSMLTVARLLLLFSIVSYFLHSYFRNTVDFLRYRTVLATPVKNRAMKYLYGNSFFLFVLAAAVFFFSVVAKPFNLASAPLVWAILAASLVLAAGALRLITMPNIRQWPRRAR